MKATIKFKTLSELVRYTQNVNSNGFRLNTVNLCRSAILSSFELAIAVEQFRARVVQLVVPSFENAAVDYFTIFPVYRHFRLVFEQLYTSSGKAK